MAKDLVIVESPTKARTIERILGNNHTVLASLGHVRDLPRHWLGVHVDRDFEPEYVVERGGSTRQGGRNGRGRQSKAELLKQIAEAAGKAGTVYLATDPDREGEAISWHLLEALRERKVVPKNTQRVVFHEITNAAVNDAFRHPRDIDMDLVDAQQARRVLDRLVGYKLTDVITEHMMSDGLTAGRVQSAALRMVVEREREIEAFVPVESWSISATLQKTATENAVEFTARLHSRQGERKALTIPDEATAEAVLADLQGAGYTVRGLQVRPVKQRPAAPFITSTLQQEAWRKLRFGARKAMTVAQSLYEGVALGAEGPVGLITYMRTDSTNLAAPAVKEMRDLIKGQYGERFLPAQPRVYTGKVKGAQEAHEAIRPTSALRTPASIKSHLTNDQHRLYDLIWKRAVACQMADAQTERTTAEIDAASPSRPGYVFRAVGSVLTFAGFRTLYLEGRDDDADDSESKMLPPLAAGDTLTCRGLKPEQHFTEPPPRYSEATLVRAMEEKGIGRPSTYATIVSTIQERDYVQRDQGRLVPTVVGRRVNDFLAQHFTQVVDLDFTARLEEELDEVAQGTRQWRVMLADFYGPFSDSLQATAGSAPREECDVCGKPMTVKRRNRDRAPFLGCTGYPDCTNRKQLPGIPGEQPAAPPLPEVTDAVCDLCGKPMTVRRRKRDGAPFLGCTGYPKCRNVRQLPGAPGEQPAAPALPEVTDAVCDLCEKPMAVRQNRWGAPFLSCTGYPKCKNAKPMPTGASCPRCGGALEERRGPPRKGRRGRSTFYGCGNYPTCDFTVPHRPLPQPCPECAGLLVHPRSEGIRCTNCAYRETEPEAATVKA